jgi:hypothetical protein
VNTRVSPRYATVWEAELEPSGCDVAIRQSALNGVNRVLYSAILMDRFGQGQREIARLFLNPTKLLSEGAHCVHLKLRPTGESQAIRLSAVFNEQRSYH